MDIDHSARYLAQKFYKINDPDYYEFEAHIFFDDAMELSDDDRLVPNSFVSDFIDCIDDALSSVHERLMTLGPPMRSPTPYGGRLTWTLPGGTQLVLHLKDKLKIRHKKRWSQVMYMYYLLGYRVMSQPQSVNRDMYRPTSPEDDDRPVRLTSSQLRHRRQSAHFTRSVIFNYVSDDVHTQAENTYILTLDGDVDFKPDAVRLLVDKLRKNKKVGAACGRIHPIGSGPIVWYQEFEYAIGHWLHKAAEHIFGCVLCAPGCFSLFRGSALMDDNVARAYAIRATEAGHLVQYDQGEDRWLSTLLLQQGYRIDYCAASDALTHAPETFSEFFNQRRRWGPSTLANCIDLLRDWRSTVRFNDNISTPYVLYQFFLLVSTILGPATVMLMMAGAFTAVFKTSVIQSYALAIIPPIVFIVICIITKCEKQITVASIMSACYAIVMTIVLVGTVSKGIEGNITSPNVLFLLMLVLIFFIAALMHPQEFLCIVHGALYFICIPTGYLLLTIYYLCNLHIVSWGTREVYKRKTREQIEAEKVAFEEKRLKKEQRRGFFGWIGLTTIITEVVHAFRMLKTTNTKTNVKPKTDQLLEELILELRQNREQNHSRFLNEFTVKNEKTDIENAVGRDTKHSNKNAETETVVQQDASLWLHKEDLQNPAWLQESSCGNGPVEYLDSCEQLFWEQLIKKYLYPINDCQVHKEKLIADLKNLRNNVVFGFFMTSALWVALSMELEILQDDLKDKFFILIYHIDAAKDDLSFEPLGLVFLVFFAGILFLQFAGMLSHRWGTILHVLSITDLSCNKKLNEERRIKDMILQAMELQRVNNIENEPVPDYDEPIPDYNDGIDGDTDTTFTTESEESGYAHTLRQDTSRSPRGEHQNTTRELTFQKRRGIFNKRGQSRGYTLQRAFERRYRYNLQREKLREDV
ncbi:hypothetical protein ScPMuIL_017639 [Solemya velum]